MSNFDTVALRLFVLNASGLGDLVGDSGVSMLCEEDVVPRVLIHERSSEVLAPNGLEGDEAVKADGVDFLSGDPCGVAARTVEGERPRGDSGRLNGDIRALLSLRPKDKGAGRSGVDGLDCSC